jgi:hypothetical protein
MRQPEKKLARMTSDAAVRSLAAKTDEISGLKINAAFGRAGKAGRKVRVEQEKVERARFMPTHEVANFFYRRGRGGTRRLRLLGPQAETRDHNTASKMEFFS